MKRMVMVMVAMLLIIGAANAGVIVSHYGANNPTNENWGINEWGSGLSSTWGHGTDPAWVVEDGNTDGGGNYTYYLDADTQTSMTDNGWRLTVDAKNQWSRENNAALIRIPTRQGVFDIQLCYNVNVAGYQYVRLFDNDAGTQNLIGSYTGVSGLNYYTIELVYDGNSSGYVDLFIDGVEVASDIDATDNAVGATSSATMLFGSGSGGDTGQGRFREVTLETIPEPATTGMIIFGGALIMFVRRLKM